MSDVLLLGNGLNRLPYEAGKGISWNDLLESLINEFSKGNIQNNDESSKPFPLLYEEILSYAINQRKKESENEEEKEIKEHIATKIREIIPNDSHKLLKKCRFSNILTTNYDYLIEQAIGETPIDAKNYGTVKEQKYSLFRKKRLLLLMVKQFLYGTFMVK